MLFCNEPNKNSENNTSLAPLTPEYNKEHHGSYVERINDALKNTQIRNIALSGNYGVGKSSILQEIATQHRKHIVEISLSTLAPMKNSGYDGSTPEDKNVHTPKQETTTNRIQQEIVKQLLYSIKPHKAPHSRFQRIERFNLWREIGVALIASVVTMIGFALTGWTDKLAQIVQPIIELGLWVHCAVFVLGGLLAFGARLLVHGRIHISKFSAGAATVTLDTKSTSYFEQYLDEIVYFFEVSKKNIVIFEDIDRFEDSYIFETLKALNTLLNTTPQIKNPIRFIYAIKDSIFVPKELNSKPEETKEEKILPEEVKEKVIPPEETEIQRANRTKFFDLIIPVVPFITHRSARDLVTQLLNGISHDIDKELITIAARYVPDMRLLKNIRNEFIIFREKLFTGDDNKLDLSESELLAMMLYKSTHLSDFELIRLGKSKLDDIYRISRDFVADNISKIEQKIRNDQSNQTNILANQIEKRTHDLGEQLIEHLHRIARSFDANINEEDISLGSNSISTGYLKTREFWESFISSESPLLNCATDKQDNTYYNSYIKLKFKYSDLPKEFTNVNGWARMEKKDFQASIDKKKTQLKALRSAHMKELIELHDFHAHHKEKRQSFDAITRSVLSNGLAYQLIKSGYINDKFTLYTSTFHSDVITATAQNFIIHNFEPNIMDEQLIFEERDIKAIISECGDQALSEPCLYNISILNYLLEFDHIKADIMIQSLIQFGEDEIRFLQAYLSGENKHTELIKKITLETVEVLEFLINQVELNNELRLSLISTALEHLNSELEYSLEDSVSKYLQEHYAVLPILTTATSKYQAKNIAKLYSNAPIRVAELKPLSEQICSAFITKDLYEVNVENLKIVLGNEKNLALDVALQQDEKVYYYLLRNLERYLNAVDNNFKTVTSKKHFKIIIDDILESKNPDCLDEVVKNASDNCIIEVLDDVQTDAWQCLADYNRFTATFNNISSYISTLHGIDEYLEAVLIKNDAIIEHETATQEEKEKLTINILNANNLSAERKVQLVNSLNLDNYIESSTVPKEMLPLLLESDLVEDCEDTYEHLLEEDWSTREHYIEASNKFHEYITPELLHSDLAAFLASGKIGSDVKATVVERAEEFTLDCSKNDLIELAQFAINQDKTLPIDVVEKMTNNQVETRSIILLLSPHLTPSINSEQLFRILERLKGDYPKLISKGTDRPEIPNTPEDQKLIKTLEALQIISSFKEIAGGFIKIFKRHK